MMKLSLLARCDEPGVIDHLLCCLAHVNKFYRVLDSERLSPNDLSDPNSPRELSFAIEATALLLSLLTRVIAQY